MAYMTRLFNERNFASAIEGAYVRQALPIFEFYGIKSPSYIHRSLTSHKLVYNGGIFKL